MSKVLLLNPPGSQPYLRDYYCSKVAKASYLYQPTDLLILSGLLAQRHEIQALDCIALGLQAHEALQHIQASQPDAVVFLSGAVSWREDRAFLREVKRLTEALLVGSGDLFLEDGAQIIADNDFVDAVLLDFTTSDLLSYLEGSVEAPPENMIYRGNDGIVQRPLKRSRNGAFEISMPRHELFPHHCYHYPTVKRRPFATVLTDYGCPYHCRFCVIGKLGYKVRPVADVLDELEMLGNMGFKEIYFNDQTFGAMRERALELCEGMQIRRCRLGWQAWTRVDVMDAELLGAMKAAGCHTLLFGVETANEEVLRTQKKGYGIERVRRTFSLCRNLGIRTLATFIVGLPGETEGDIRNTIRFALELDPDFASFNVLVPRAGTEIRTEALAQGWIRQGNISLDQSGSYPIMGNERLSAHEVWQLKNEAVRAFYARPGFWLRRLRKISTFYELCRNLANGWTLFRSMVAKRADRSEYDEVGKVLS